MNKPAPWFAVAACLALGAAACSKNASSTTSPSSSATAATNANADGSLLKATAPTPLSPVNGVKLDPSADSTIPLTIKNAALTNSNAPLSYAFELATASGTVVFAVDLPGTPTNTVAAVPSTIDLIGDQTYQWRARAFVVSNGTAIPGPWSGWATFVAPVNSGYIRGNELYDPMLDGKTVGSIHGPVTFIPGKGFRMDAEDSWIEYIMPQTCNACEFSALVNNLHSVSDTEDPKNTVISARVGFSSFNDNPYRLSVDKRGNNAVAWRFITGDLGNYIETLGTGERPIVNFRSANQYFVEAKWRNQVFTVTYRENSPTGTVMYQSGKPYGREYRPNPLVAYAGRPWIAGERGEPSTVEGMIIRQMWLSPNARPGYANK